MTQDKQTLKASLIEQVEQLEAEEKAAKHAKNGPRNALIKKYAIAAGIALLAIGAFFWLTDSHSGGIEMYLGDTVVEHSDSIERRVFNYLNAIILLTVIFVVRKWKKLSDTMVRHQDERELVSDWLKSDTDRKKITTNVASVHEANCRHDSVVTAALIIGLAITLSVM